MIRRLEVGYRDQARTDLDKIFWHIAYAGSPQAALGYVQRLEDRCQRLGDAPRSGRPRDDLAPGLRTISFEGSALICYIIADDAIWINNVFRRGRDIDAFFGEEAGTRDDG